MSSPMKVAVARCQTYDLQQVETAIKQLIDHLGGLEKFIRPGQIVAVKPNLIAKKKPEEAATTHPAVVEALVRLIQQAGGKPFIVDSPGGPGSKSLLNAVYKSTGMSAVAERTGCGLSLDTTELVLAHPKGQATKQLTVLKVLAEADVIIGVPKLKTHCMTLYTGAIKLMYGAIPGLKKAEYHFNMQRLEQFCNLLIDINTLLPTTLTIMDGIIGMEGDGPTAGSPREVGLLLASQSPYVMDSVCSDLIGINPRNLPIIRLAKERGLGPEAELIGEPLPEVKPPFKLPRHKQVDFNIPGPFKSIISKLQPTPIFSPELCIGCGECHRCCPADAIQMVEGRPQLKPAACIRCFCCQELCPHRAVTVHQNWLGRKILR